MPRNCNPRFDVIQMVMMATALALCAFAIPANAAEPNTCVDSATSAILAPANRAALCKGAETSTEPGTCYARVMGGTVSFGGGTNWNPTNAVRLCAGAPNANARIGCFNGKIAQGVTWGTAIDQCTGKSASIDPTVLAKTGAPTKAPRKVPTRPTSDSSRTCSATEDCDGDGVSIASGDCDDNDAARFPGNAEQADFIGHDEDCNDSTYGVLDADYDGYTDARVCNGASCGLDCDDTRASVSPVGAELPNRRDDNCNGLVDDDLEGWWNPAK